MFGRIDWDDRMAAVAFLLASAINNHIVDGPEFLGWTLRDGLFTIGAGTGDPATITLGKVVALGALAGTIATNRTDFSRLTGVEMWVAIATIGLVLSPPFVPLLEFLLRSNMIAGSVALVIQAGGFFTISYLG
jgi:hypothetical protein